MGDITVQNHMNACKTSEKKYNVNNKETGAVLHWKNIHCNLHWKKHDNYTVMGVILGKITQ